MKKLAVRSVIAASLALGVGGISAGSASADTMSQEGCTEWNSSDGCVVQQYWTLNTDARSWTCVWYDTRTGSMKAATGTY